MTIKHAEQKIKEARQRVVAVDRDLADLRRVIRKIPRSLETRAALRAMREQSIRLDEERCKAWMNLVEVVELSEMPPEYMGWA